MTGLLYKDFISIKGKKLTVVYLVIFAVNIIMRLVMPHVFRLVKGVDTDMADMMADGLYWAAGLLLFITVYGAVVNAWPTKLIEDDKTRGKVIDYYSSLPVKKDQYIASHYILIGISSYVVFSLTMIWYVVGSSLNSSEKTSLLWPVTMPIVFEFVYLGIIFAAIDLGAYISLGTSKGKIVRVALALIVGTAILWFIFFGDIEKVKNMKTEMIFEWITAHQFELSLSEILGPFAVLAIYYLSYRISCHFSNKGAY